MQTSGMLLRHGHIWNERTPAGKLSAAWTRDCVDWAGSVELREGSPQGTLKAYLEATVSAVDDVVALSFAVTPCFVKSN